MTRVGFFLALFFSQIIVSNNDINFSVETYKDLVRVGLSQNKLLESQKDNILISELNIEQAGLWENPDLQGDILFGSNSGFGVGFELALMQNIQLGGQKGHEKQIAELGRVKSRVALEKSKGEIALSLLIGLLRFEQIQHEIENQNEVIETYKNNINKYLALAKQSQEQEISLEIFKLALLELKGSKVELENQKLKIKADFESILGVEVDLGKLKNNLEIDFKNFIKNLSQNEYLYGNRGIKLLKLDKLISNKKIKLDKAGAWPDLKIGPKIAYEQVFQTGQRSSFWGGVAFEIGLPVWNQNSLKIKKSKVKREQSDHKFDYVNQNIHAQKEYLIKTFVHNYQIHEELLESEKIIEQHEKIHQNISQGLISASVALDFHREYLNYFRLRHEQELKLASGYWKLKLMDGLLLAWVG